eukprot:IDg18361t1
MVDQCRTNEMIRHDKKQPLGYRQ